MGKKYDARKVSLPSKLREAWPDIETVSDGDKIPEFDVTGRDKRGVSRHGVGCAAARACERQLDIDLAYIGFSYSFLVKGTHATRYRTPATLQRELISNDRHMDFTPGHYFLSLVPPSQRLGRRKNIPRGRKDGSRPRAPHRIYTRTSRRRTGGGGPLAVA